MTPSPEPVEFVLPAEREALPRLHAALDQYGRTNGLPAKLLSAVQLVLEEHLTNIILYGYPGGKAGRITVRLRLLVDRVHLEVEDDGRPFNPLERPPVDVTPPIDQRPLGGLGIHLMRQLADHLEYHHEGGCNIVTFQKQLPQTTD